MLPRNAKRLIKGWTRPKKAEIWGLAKRIDRAATKKILAELGKSENIDEITAALEKRHETSRKIARALAAERAMNAAGIFSPEKRKAIRNLFRKLLVPSQADPETASRVNAEYFRLAKQEAGPVKGKLLLKRYKQIMGKFRVKNTK